VFKLIPRLLPTRTTTAACQTDQRKPLLTVLGQQQVCDTDSISVYYVNHGSGSL